MRIHTNFQFIFERFPHLHRIGRTGRFGKSGIAINMIENQDDMRILKEIEAHFKRTIEQINYNDIDDLEEKLND